MKLFLNYKYLLENKQKIARVAIIALLIMAALFLFLFRTGNQNEKEMMKQKNIDSQSELKTDEPSDMIIVDVAGEVKNPSVIELPADSRINDAIQAAGGLTGNADISQINRAAILTDGEKIFVPTAQKSQTNSSGGKVADGNQEGDGNNESTSPQKININYASTTELQEVPGIGPVTADKIIQYRNDKGLFRKLEDIKNVSGIGDKTFEKMKTYICI